MLNTPENSEKIINGITSSLSKYMDFEKQLINQAAKAWNDEINERIVSNLIGSFLYEKSYKILKEILDEMLTPSSFVSARAWRKDIIREIFYTFIDATNDDLSKEQQTEIYSDIAKIMEMFLGMNNLGTMKEILPKALDGFSKFCDIDKDGNFKITSSKIFKDLENKEKDDERLRRLSEQRTLMDLDEFYRNNAKNIGK